MLQNKEITSLIINSIFVKMLLTFPRIVITNSGNAAWLQIILNVLAVLLIYFITILVYKEKKNVIELADEKCGKWLKIPTGIIITLILFTNFLAVIKIFPETIRIVLLKKTPANLIVLLLAAAVFIGAYMGIESIARIHYIFLPIAGGVLVLFLFLLIPYYSTDNIFPIFGSGTVNVFLKGFRSLSLFSDIILLNILLPFAKTLEEVKKSGFKSIVISGIIAIMIVLAYCLVYPYPVSENFVFPVYQLARMVHLSSFLSRFEAFFQFLWSILTMLYASFYVYAICFVWQQTFSLKFYKPIIFPIIILSFSISMIPDSMINANYIEKIINGIIFSLAFVIPVLFGLIFKRKKDKGNGSK